MSHVLYKFNPHCQSEFAHIHVYHRSAAVARSTDSPSHAKFTRFVPWTKGINTKITEHG